MEIVSNSFISTSFSPCDTTRFPAACFRFLIALSKNLFTVEPDPCRTQTDEYHYIGCIWGLAFTRNLETKSIFEICYKYLPEKGETDGVQARRHAACIDGILSAKPTDSFPDRLKEKYCKPLEGYPLSLNVCKTKMENTFQTFTFTEEDDNQFYNMDILERDYDPSIKPTKAEFFSEWISSIWSGGNKPIQQGPTHTGHH